MSASVAILAILALMSCQSRTVYHGYHATPEGGWYRGDTVLLRIPAMDHDGTYLEEAGFRTSTRYPFTTFRMVVDQTIYHGKGKKQTVTNLSDTITCRVSDDNGKPLGDGLDIYQYTVPFRQQRLNAGDSIHIRITHGMQRTAITGITDVGIRIESP